MKKRLSIISIEPADDKCFLICIEEEEDGGRQFGIILSEAKGLFLQKVIENEDDHTDPHLYNFLINTILELHGQIDYLLITIIENNVFEAEIHLSFLNNPTSEELKPVSVRIYDGIILCLLQKKPIYADSRLIDLLYEDVGNGGKIDLNKWFPNIDEPKQ